MATAYTQALLDRATAHVGQPLDKRRYAEGLAEISQLVSDITGQPNGGCRQCQYLDYLSTVNQYIRAATRFLHPALMSDSKYTIVSPYTNEQFVHEGLSEAVTAENLTDQTAEFLISKGFGHAIKLKDGSEPSPAGSSEPVGAQVQPTEREKQLEQDAATAKQALSTEETNHQATNAKLVAEQTAHKATKEALKAEKKVTAALVKERDELTRQLAEANDKLAKAEQPESTQPAAEVDPATVS